jgi:hypothetical protein
MNKIFLAVGTAFVASLIAVSSPARAAETSTPSWYFATTTQPNTSVTYVWQEDAHRAPGLSPDLTSYFLDGTYVTPAMAFAPAFTSSVSAYTVQNISPSAFVPRNSNSAISFENLPATGTSPAPKDVLLVNFSYVNRGADRTLTVRDDVFSPSGAIVSSSTLTRLLRTNEYSPFKLPLYFGASPVEAGTYCVRVRVYDPLLAMPVDENSFNFRFKQ